jgi:mRNA interferase MazF
MADYIPEKGDVVWLSFSPQAGHEQAARRPALVLSPKEYNGKVGLSILCPITNQIKGYPFEVAIPEECDVQGVVISDQVKNLDWRIGNAEYFCGLPDETVSETLCKLHALLFLDN